jgi:hypothetical protein
MAKKKMPEKYHPGFEARKRYRLSDAPIIDGAGARVEAEGTLDGNGTTAQSAKLSRQLSEDPLPPQYRRSLLLSQRLRPASCLLRTPAPQFPANSMTSCHRIGRIVSLATRGRQAL